MSFLSTRRRTGTLLFAALVNPINGQMWRVTGGTGNWAVYNPATSLPAEFVFAFAESPAGSGRLVIAAPPTGFTSLTNVPAGMSVSVWLITVASGVPTNAAVVAGGISHPRRWDATTSRLVDSAEYAAEQARLQALTATSTAARPYLAKIGLEQGTSPLASVVEITEGALGFVIGGDSVGMILTSPDTDLSYRITAYNSGAATLAAEPIGHTTPLFTAVGDVYNWFVSRPATLPSTAPAGYGGSTQVRAGGGRLSPVASGLDGQITSFASDVLPVRFDLIGQDGQAISNVGATLTGTLTNAAGAVQASAVAISTSGLNVGEGELLATVTLPATAGTYQLTITRTASAADVQTFGPFAIKAGRK